MVNARKLAVKALVSVNRDGAYSNLILNEILSKKELSSVVKSFVSALFYGVLDRKITIDYVLSKYIKKPLKKITPYTMESLRIAVYQIMFMERIPQSAAVNESVKIVKSSKESFNASFANGVLRNIIRNGTKLPKGNSPEELSIRYSCPIWIIQSFIKDYSLETTINLLKASLLNPPITLRVNTLKTNSEELIVLLEKEGITAEKTSIYNALNIVGGAEIQTLDCYKKGLFHIQDLASQIAVSKLSLKPNERVLDVCAAPGGKTFTMAQFMENKGEIVAFDLHEKRVNLINSSASRLGIDIIKATTFDATNPYKNEYFDAVLCDVPCSGLGVLRRKPEIKYKNCEDFTSLSSIQKKILQNGANALKKGGRLLYSTCTLRRAENEEVVKSFIENNSGYTLKYEHTFMPHIDGTDGFYCALIEKK